jgi:pyruvate ferredoxin oxidoreductase alpha subunit
MSPTPIIDAEIAPGRYIKDPFVMKSNYISYATHASWQWEVRAAIERSRPYAKHYLRGLIEEYGDPEAELVFVASGTAASQAKEATRMLLDEGIKAKVVKVKSIRPFPHQELLEATKNAKYIMVPEFNVVGWLEREVRAAFYGKSNATIIGTPRVAGGMTMPPEIIYRDALKILGKEVSYVL